MTNPPRTSDEIRSAFLSFFEERGHTVLPPWPLVPIGDPTSLFTSAGMQQFKPQFMGEQPAVSARAATVQRCFRTTDIEVVGDPTHCTAFEMLGNFSFGDYFKKGAIEFAWELLTGVYQIPVERLHATIFLTDDEAHDHWRAVGMPEDHIHRRDEDLNYWFSFPNGVPGANGPCGPDSEIYYDFHPERGIDDAQLRLDAAGEPVAGVGYDEDRFVEIWNLVFMQLYQHPDGTRTDLPAKNIDTGSGLERVSCVLQGVRTVYETDIFLPILQAASRVLGVAYDAATEEQKYVARAMSEHCRAATLLVGDGVVPSNEGRGYVLRRVLRRAIYLARRAGVHDLFTRDLAAAAVAKLSDAYPHLREQRDFILRAVGVEEERFVRTLEAGSARLEAMLARLRESGAQALPGDEAFLLYDTYGMPIELTREIGVREGFTLDEAGFQTALAAQREQSKRHGAFLKGEVSPALQRLGEDHSAFLGYEHTEADAHVVAILRDGSLLDMSTEGEACEIILDATPFYPEGGGQIGDHGNIRTRSGVFLVEDTQASGGAIVHRGRVTEGEIRVNDAAQATVDVTRRWGAARNHTGTHLLHAALRSVLGTHVRQQGSLVTPDRLRFDFTHLEQTPREALNEAQQIANEKVRHDVDVTWRTTGYRQAVEAGALAFFGDKYGSEVRVVEIRDEGRAFSAELCGGTHVHHTGEIGFVHILRESAVAAGTRRIEALTGRAAEQHLVEQQDRLLRLAEKLGTAPGDIEDRVDSLQEELERLRTQNEQLEHAQAVVVADELVAAARAVGGSHLAIGRVNVASSEAMKDVADRVRAKLPSSVVVLGAAIDGTAAFVVAVTPDLVNGGVNAAALVREVAKVAGGGGGGSAGLAQAGAKDATRLGAALEQAASLGAAAIEAASRQ